MTLTPWKLNADQRWHISMMLKTASPLHIGSGKPGEHDDIFLIETNVEGNETKKLVDINDCIKGKNNLYPADTNNNLPIIPGSSIKGTFLNWLNTRKKHENKTEFKQLRSKLFGDEHDRVTTYQGRAGKVEFHDAYISEELADGSTWPYWCKEKQTFIDTSTSIDRHSKTALNQSLHYTECVPPGVVFTFTFTGFMNEQEAGLLITILDSFYSNENQPFFGADNANGYGRMEFVGDLKIKKMGNNEIATWLADFNTDNMPMAMQKASELSPEKKQQLKDQAKKLFKSGLTNVNIPVTLKFDGPFIVNDPYKVKQLQEQADPREKRNHYPLLDTNKKTKLPSSSIRGTLRSQAERIIRTLGGSCCDTHNPCPPLYETKNLKELCLACQIFGASGWKTVININEFTCQNSPNQGKQEFVGIDRFHGGGKDGAKFNATVFESPIFTGAISFSPRMQEHGLNWGKGLIALVLKDLDEGDITFGLGASKGYGSLEKNASEIGFTLFDESDIGAFRDKFSDLPALWQSWAYSDKWDMFLEAAQTWHCDEIKKPTAQGEKTPIISTASSGTGFLNPYQFIPIPAPNSDHWYDREPGITNQSSHSHGFYRNQTEAGEPLHHGRITCQLTTETPIFIGAEQTENTEPTQITNYKLNNKIAIPATSLRGMISSLAEAASNSSMRVLDNGLLSFRKPMKKSLSAIGIVIKQNKQFRLIPLALPTLRKKGKTFSMDEEYKTMFPDGQAKLKVYLNNEYLNDTDNKTWTSNENEIYYFNLTEPQTLSHGRIQNSSALRKPKNREDSNFVIGQIPLENAKLTKHPTLKSTPGLLRIFGHKSIRKDNVPSTKTHELFIPIAEKYVENNQFNLQKLIENQASFEIPDCVVKRFHKLADQQTKSQNNVPNDEEWLPYHLKGMQRTSEHKLRLQIGDLVYFCPNKNKPSVVEEITFSSIWRDRVEENAMNPSTVPNFVPAELRPFNTSRTKISPTELLFGFVELNPEEVESKKDAAAFAGKVRISAGIACSEDLVDEQNPVTLKALSSPKLPSPSLYFQTKESNSYIAKQDLSTQQHTINGRKYYLHAMQKDNHVQKLTSKGKPSNGGDSKFPWVTQNSQDNPQLKVQITPIKKEKSFKFYIDFNNLTDWELGLLSYALRPAETFRHRLGMGKPLGLGTVKIDIEEIKTINRKQRYLEDEIGDARYNQEQTFAIEQLRKTFTDTMNPDIYRALDLLGDPKNVKSPVHYPQVESDNIELENFKWFVANDDPKCTNRQTLKGLKQDTDSLPTLIKH